LKSDYREQVDNGKKTMKILFISSSDSHGGAAKTAYRIFDSLREQGVEVKMLVRDKSTNDPDVISCLDFERKGIVGKFDKFIWKIKNRIRKRKWKEYPDRETVFLNDLNSISLIRAINSVDFDIIHLHFIANRFLNLNELTKIGKPIVWTLHDCWPFTGICHYFYECRKYTISCGQCPFLHSVNESDLSNHVWKKKKYIYNKLDIHVVTPSSWLAEASRKSTLFANFPVIVIPNPIDVDLFSPGDRKQAADILQLATEKKYLLFGAMNAVKDTNKGFHYLIQTLQYFELNYLNSGIELLIVGAEQPLEELNLKISVKYLGVINSDEKMTLIYKIADVMVVPSLSENLSNAIMESLSCGTPVVAFNIGGNGDMIDHKLNGYLAKPFKVNDLAKGINWCLENNREMNLSKKARLKVEGNYKEENIASKYANLYSQVIENSTIKIC